MIYIAIKDSVVPDTPTEEVMESTIMGVYDTFDKALESNRERFRNLVKADIKAIQEGDDTETPRELEEEVEDYVSEGFQFRIEKHRIK